MAVILTKEGGVSIAESELQPKALSTATKKAAYQRASRGSGRSRSKKSTVSTPTKAAQPISKPEITQTMSSAAIERQQAIQASLETQARLAASKKQSIAPSIAAQQRTSQERRILDRERRALIQEGLEKKVKKAREEKKKTLVGEKVGIEGAGEVTVPEKREIKEPKKFKETKAGSWLTRDIKGVNKFKELSTSISEIKGGLFVGGTSFFLSKGERETTEKGFKAGARAGEFIGKVQSELIPSTPAGIGLVAGGSAALIFTPPVVSTAAGVGFGVVGTAGALKKDLPPEQRVASGIIGVLGFAGAGASTYPYIKGQLTRVLPSYKPTIIKDITFGKLTREAKFVENIAGIKGQDFSLGLIPEAKGRGSPKGAGAGEGAVIGGGFGFSPKEQIKAFSGKTLRLTTSQRDLIQGREVIPPSTEKGFELGFFFTPADPLYKYPQTRVSRLGLSKGFLEFKKPQDISLGIVSGGKPEIIITEPTKIVSYGKTGTGGTARISPKGSSELEATSFSNIQVYGKRGDIIVKGQRVPIYEGRLTTQELKSFKIGEVTRGDVISSKITPPKTSVVPSTTVLLGTGTIIKGGVTKETTGTTTKIFSGTGNISSGGGSGGGSKPPTTTTSKAISTPPITFTSPITPRIPKITPPISPPRTPRITQPPPKSFGFPKQKPKKREVQSKYSVSVRRFGEFKTIGTGLGLRQAFSLGREKVGGTLAATFKLTPQGRQTKPFPPAPKGFYIRKKKGDILFIEKSKFRLSTPSETKEIQTFKLPKMKGGVF